MEVWTLVPFQLEVARYLGWVSLATLRQTHRNALWASSEMLLARTLEAILGRPAPTVVPRPYGPLSRQLWAETIGYLRRFCTPRDADRRPTALGGRPIREVVVRHVGRHVWHQFEIETLAPQQIHGVFPHGGFDRASHWLATRGSHFRRVEHTARHRASRVHFVLTEKFAVNCNLFGLEVSLRITYRTVLPTEHV